MKIKLQKSKPPYASPMRTAAALRFSGRPEFCRAPAVPQPQDFHAGCMMKPAVIFLTMLSLVGCTPSWEKTKAPDITGSNALASTLSFVATNGWDSFAKTNDYIFWHEDEPTLYISGLPWKRMNNQRFPALTSGGVLYVLLGDAFHHDYYGVAYNPNTNHFPEWIREFKPVGGHWYVWAQPEFWSTDPTEGHYE